MGPDRKYSLFRHEFFFGARFRLIVPLESKLGRGLRVLAPCDRHKWTLFVVDLTFDWHGQEVERSQDRKSSGDCTLFLRSASDSIPTFTSSPRHSLSAGSRSRS